MKMNKRNSIIAVALISLSSMAFAFGPKMNGPESGGGYRMAQELNLTAEQQEQVKEIMAKHRNEAEKKREQHRNELESKLSTVLTAEQMEKFKDIKQNKRDKRKGSRGCDRK